MNCLNFVGYVLRVKHTERNYSHEMVQYKRISAVSESRGIGNGYIYYLSFSSLEYSRVHTETPLQQFSSTLSRLK